MRSSHRKPNKNTSGHLIHVPCYWSHAAGYIGGTEAIRLRCYPSRDVSHPVAQFISTCMLVAICHQVLVRFVISVFWLHQCSGLHRKALRFFIKNGIRRRHRGPRPDRRHVAIEKDTTRWKASTIGHRYARVGIGALEVRDIVVIEGAGRDLQVDHQRPRAGGRDHLDHRERLDHPRRRASAVRVPTEGIGSSPIVHAWPS